MSPWVAGLSVIGICLALLIFALLDAFRGKDTDSGESRQVDEQK